MNQYCESCKYFFSIVDGIGVCSVEPGRYRDVVYERRACRFYQQDYDSFTPEDK